MDDASFRAGEIPVGDHEHLRVVIADRRGAPMLDVRIFSPLTVTSGVQTSTGRGFTVGFDALHGLIEALENAMTEAVRRGLIDAHDG